MAVAVNSTVLDMATAEREELLALLESLTSDQWARPTLCGQWTVRDLAAHVISYDVIGLRRVLTSRLMMPMNRFNAVGVQHFGELSTDELCDAYRAHIRPRGYMAAFGGIVGLLDSMIHQQDIRRPLGLARRIDPDRLRVALGDSLYFPLIYGAWRARGVRLVATDVNWTHGTGPEVHAPGEPLLMALAGRRSVYNELDGPGASTLRSRLR